MSGTNQNPSEETKPLTAAAAAALVKRPVPAKSKDGEPTDKFNLVEVKTAEVLDFKQYDDRVVVVTRDGQKFEATL